MNTSYSVYVVNDELSSLVKIGLAKDIGQRMRQYKTHNPHAELQFTMTLNGGEAEDAALVERMAFYLLSDYRREGEWFETSVSIAKDAIERAANLWMLLTAYKCLCGVCGGWYADELSGDSGPPVLFNGEESIPADEATVGDMRRFVGWFSEAHRPFTQELELRKRQLAELPTDTEDRRIFEVLRDTTVLNLVGKCLER